MRIAVSGTHRVGKTTLAGALSGALPGHDLVDEPYHDLVAEGHVFPHPPGIDDFEEQLEHSLDTLEHTAGDVVFDRCPLDLLAYVGVSSPDRAEALEHWRDRVEQSVRSLDAVVFVPLETPDRVEVTDEEDPAGTREMVDETLRELLLGGGLALDVGVVEVRGTPEQRMTTAMAWLTRAIVPGGEGG